ncbi:MAG: pyridoxal-phosphate dependent enzyme [Chloroflexota bacterium]|nr:pyridoxal-phosphate dependent enzyme [Chloroflexota bacterium]
MREMLTEQYIHQVWDMLPRHVKPTTFQNTFLLSQALGADVTLASETLQITGSFKFRAAYNLLAEVTEQDVITASSGNFGQAVAYACMLLGKGCTVIMPNTSSKSKQAAIVAYGGRVELIDVTTKSRQERIREMRDERPDAFFAPPYDHYRVVAGNSTLGREIIEKLHGAGEQKLDYIVCPIGGGGLISGIIVARDLLAPDLEVIGVEPLLGNDAAQSLREGRLISLENEPQTMADGTRTLCLGDLNWEIIKGGVRRVVEVPEEKIASGTRLLYRAANLKVEPTGALTIGAVLTEPALFKGKRICCVVSGGNVDPEVYAGILESS